jgi:hypothetical protein
MDVDPDANLHLLCLDRALDFHREQDADARTVVRTANAFRDFVQYGNVPDGEVNPE